MSSRAAATGSEGFQLPPSLPITLAKSDFDHAAKLFENQSVQTRPGEQIGKFSEAIDEALANVEHRLPEDLIFARTSGQPLQAAANSDF